MKIAHFTIKNRFQKGGLYQTLLKPAILADICLKATGQLNYTVDFVDAVNIGRLATLEFEGSIFYISFSEDRIGGRNASFQSFPSALVSFYKEKNENKGICFYFLPTIGRYETTYFNFMYRLMKTAGTMFLNEQDYLKNPILPFATIEDIIVHKNTIRGKNKSNNSTYLTKDEQGTVQIFGKTYGASKYETTLICLAAAKIADSALILYEIEEGNLTKLPKSSREAIESIEKFTVITSDLTLERKEFEENDSLRSPAYIYNLLEKLGDKKCALCDCEIPQIIQGAHILPVANIKKMQNITQDQKLKWATDGDNGLWLCNNHHKLFDINLIIIEEDGNVKVKSDIRDSDKTFIQSVTNVFKIKHEILTSNFLQYLKNRNSLVKAVAYSPIV